MYFELRHIQSSIQQIVSAIAAVLKIEVEVADVRLFRIAGTGLIKQKIWQGMSGEDAVYQQCIEKGEPIIIDNPGFHKLCDRCPHVGHCIESGEVCTPIKINDSVIGVIGLIAFDETQRNRLFSDLEANILFMKKIAEVIATKANETLIFRQQLISEKKISTLINCIDMGVIMRNKYGEYEFISKIARDMLQLSGESEADRKALDQFFAQKGLQRQGRIVWMTIDSRPKNFFVTAHPVTGLDQSNEAEVILIEDPEQIARNASHIKEHKETIDFIGSTSEILNLKQIFSKLKDKSIPILISGENGTGKTSAARYLHTLGRKPENKFVKINVSFYSDKELNTLLFEETDEQPCLLDRLDGGTLVLDEIDQLHASTQMLLLRFLNNQALSYSDGRRKGNVRLVSLTNRHLLDAVQDGSFRQDLYYRIGVVPITMPPLRRRKSDMMPLALYFLDQLSGETSGTLRKIFTATIQEILCAYDWPGNIQELVNVISYAFNISDGSMIRPDHLPDYILVNYQKMLNDTEKRFNLQEMEKKTIRKALLHVKNTGKNKEDAAALLGIGRATLFRKIAAYRIQI